MNTLYDILEVSNKASKEVIEKAYKVLAKKYHPDVQTSENKKYAEDMMKKINDAYETLSDEIKRKNYDEQIEEQQNLEKEKMYQEINEERYNSQIRYANQKEDNYEVNKIIEWQKMYAGLNKEEQRKLRKKIAREANNDYRNRYEAYFRSLGYKVKHHWSWKEIKILLISIISLIIIFFIMWWIPPTHNWMISIYENNILIEIIVKIIIGIFSGIGEFFKNILSI